MSTKQQNQLRALDELVCRQVLQDKGSGGNPLTIFTCICPLCNGKRRPKEHSQTVHVTAHVYCHPKGEGLAFGCAACNANIFSIHELLCRLGHHNIADWYASKRWEFDRACGKGWTCPLPKQIAKSFQEKWREKRCENIARRLSKLDTNSSQ